MEFLPITQNNIFKTTGFTVSELLDQKPKTDARLQLLRREEAKGPDFLVRGNPQLTLGFITSIEEVDDYFSNKEE